MNKHLHKILEFYFNRDFSGIVEYLKSNSSEHTAIGFILPPDIDMSDQAEIVRVALKFYLSLYFASVPPAGKLVEMLLDKDNQPRSGFEILQEWFNKDIREN